MKKYGKFNRTIDEALEALNELRDRKDKELYRHIDHLRTDRDGWRELYEQKKRENIELMERVSKLQDELRWPHSR